ncbi:TPA: small membrane protein [Klebsiella variicola subsp. variicola]|nr:small membrane protein [Klebsiella variicola subsp. variicola]
MEGLIALAAAGILLVISLVSFLSYRKDRKKKELSFKRMR